MSHNKTFFLNLRGEVQKKREQIILTQMSLIK